MKARPPTTSLGATRWQGLLFHICHMMPGVSSVDPAWACGREVSSQAAAFFFFPAFWFLILCSVRPAYLLLVPVLRRSCALSCSLSLLFLLLLVTTNAPLLSHRFRVRRPFRIFFCVFSLEQSIVLATPTATRPIPRGRPASTHRSIRRYPPIPPTAEGLLPSERSEFLW